MKIINQLSFILSIVLLVSCTYKRQKLETLHTVVDIIDDMFYINGKPTYEGRYWGEYKVEGLLMNSRMVQGIYDDINPDTQHLWAYPDTGEWCPDRNTNEFVQNMESWRNHGMLAFTLNLQGGSPTGYGNQGWINSAFSPTGELLPAYMDRLDRILLKADELGMVVILGLYYFGQDQYLVDEEAVVKGVDNVLNWLFDKGYRNILIEISNECDMQYDHEILKYTRVHELIERVKETERNGYSYLAGTSFGQWEIPLPTDEVIAVSDFVLLHGNSAHQPERIEEVIQTIRNNPVYTNKPIIYNEDDHYEFDKADNNFVRSVKNYSSWGYFDFRKEGQPFENGFQSVPVDWAISSERKKLFFKLMSEITGISPKN